MRRRTAPGDPSLVAIEKMRRRWQRARETRLDLPALEVAMRQAFPGTETRVLPLEDFPGACRLFVWTRGGWRSMYAFQLDHVAAFAAGATRV